ncbi:hypothetical protein O0L34_g15238 [Tuta absoluta]|nr:hypothetical protein O0L34_g15238 [Tuta absoluta]
MSSSGLFHVKILYLIAGICLILILIYPTLLSNFSSRSQEIPPTAVEKSIYERRFYDIEQLFNHVLNARKPQRPLYKHQHKLFDDELQRRWPHFSPGHKRTTTENGVPDSDGSEYEHVL